MTQHYPTREQAVRLLSYLPTRVDYDVWVRVISAIGNTFGEAEALSILHTHWSDEKPNETARKLAQRIPSINFGALVNIAKRYGWTPGRESLPNDHDKQNSRLLHTHVKQNDVPDFDVEQHSQPPLYDAEGNRLLRVAFNQNIINKPNGSIPINNKFYNASARIEVLIAFVTRIGCAFSPSQFVNQQGEYNNGADHRFWCDRRSTSWVGSEILALDFDGTMSMEDFKQSAYYKHCVFAYTTPSHTAENHRYRAVWVLPRFITEQRAYRAMVKKFIEYYNADSKCKDLARFYYGNSNAIVMGGI